MTWRARVIITAIILIAVMLLFPPSAQAGKILHINTVQAGRVIENDVFLTGKNPLVEGTVNGNVFVFGSDVEIKGDVNGSLFIIAEKVSLEGEVSGNVYVLSAGFIQKAESQIGRSLYMLGTSLILEKDSSIVRDLNATTLSAGLRGEIGRDTKATVGFFELLRLLRESVRQSITGLPSADQLAQINPQRITQKLAAPRHALMRMVAPATDSAFMQWLLTSSMAYIAFLTVGLLSIWMLPIRFQTWVRKVEEKPLASAGYGAIVLVNGYLMPALLTALLGGAVLGLLYLSLPSLAWMIFWGVLGLSVALFSLFLISVAFLSKTIVAYLAGEFILSKFAPKALQYKILPLLLGLLIYVPLASIRYVGFFIGLVVTLLGLGSLWLTRHQAQITVEARAEVAPVAAAE
jgi:hypothetical protein